MRTNVIIFDLDDTLIDTRIRHYKILQDFLKEKGIEFICYRDYLSKRRQDSASNLSLIKELFPLAEEGFNEFWLQNIESEKYLQYDREIVNVKLLNELKIRTNSMFVILSLRKQKDIAENQCLSFSFFKNFQKLIFLPHSSVNPKLQFLKEFKKQFNVLFFVGDSTNDRDASLAADVPFYAVDTGFYSLSSSRIYPDINHLLLQLPL
jgi:phosphoglycolate phosphatase-like HAD superfamily hydrolase